MATTTGRNIFKMSFLQVFGWKYIIKDYNSTKKLIVWLFCKLTVTFLWNINTKYFFQWLTIVTAQNPVLDRVNLDRLGLQTVMQTVLAWSWETTTQNRQYTESLQKTWIGVPRYGICIWIDFTGEHSSYTWTLFIPTALIAQPACLVDSGNRCSSFNARRSRCLFRPIYHSHYSGPKLSERLPTGTETVWFLFLYTFKCFCKSKNIKFHGHKM